MKETAAAQARHAPETITKRRIGKVDMLYYPHALKRRGLFETMEHYMKKRYLWKQSWKDSLVEQYQAALNGAVSTTEKSFRGR